MRRDQRAAIFIDFETDPNEFGGGNRVNRACADFVRRRHRVVPDRAAADLQIASFSWNLPDRPNRLFIDHGAFGSAAFWSYSAPGLLASDTILVSSTVCERIAARLIRGDGPRIARVPFPIDTGLFRPLPDRGTARRDILAAHGIPADGPLILVVAAYARRKNHHLAVLFFERILKHLPTARLALVGSTPDLPENRAYRQAVDALVSGRGLRDRTHFLSQLSRTDLAPLMGAADLLIHFSNWLLENFGLVVGEALAAGLPVVAADWAGFRDLVTPGENGLLARTYLTSNGPRTDWMSMVGPVVSLLGTPSARDTLSRGARRRAQAELAVTAYEERLDRELRAAIASRAPEEERLALSDAGLELMFRTMSLNALHPEIRSAGDEHRLLMPLDGGTHYRLLSGPAATSETPPRVGPGDRLYAVAAWEAGPPGTVTIIDPAWPGALTVDDLQRTILSLCDSTRTLEDVTRDSPGTSIDLVLGRAQDLVDRGILCPLADGRG